MPRFVRSAAAILAASTTALVGCTGSGSPEPGNTVIAVRITPDNPVVLDNATLSFVAFTISETGEQKDVTDSPATTWASSDSGVLSVNADGSAEAGDVGTAYVTATVSGVTSPAQLVTVNAAPTPTPTPPPSDHLVISEVMYNPNVTQGNEPAGQYVEIFNPTGSNVNITGWTVNNNNGTGTAFTFGAFTLNAGAFVVLANDPTLFDGDPYPTVVDIFQYVMPNLSNTGDWFVLHNDTAVLIDEMAYGTGFSSTKPSGWCASNLPSASDGFPASRSPANLDGNTCADFVANAAPSPGLVTP